MSDTDKAILNRLFRDHGDILGASKTTLISLQALIASIELLKSDKDSFREEITKLQRAVMETEPKIVPLMHLLEEWQEDLNKSKETTLAGMKRYAVRSLQGKIQEFKDNVRLTVEHGIDQVKDGDIIIVHSSSSIVKSILIRAKTVKKKRFEVLVLEQDMRITKELLKALIQAKIEHMVVPEYCLNHHLDRANKLFFGAVSVTPDRKAITGVGTSGIVSLCHLYHIKVYLFINSLKFAHQSLKDQNIHSKTVIKWHNDYEYNLYTHSHDHVSLDHIDYIYTEKGLINNKRGRAKRRVSFR